MTDDKIISTDAQAKPATGRIIGGASGRIISAATAQSAHDDIPFVPAYDLLEASNAESSLSTAEVAAIAAALWVATQPVETSSNGWSAHARFAAVSQRLNS